MTTYDVAVVGGGIAGLVAAASAAREGAKVVLVDGAKELGGRARSDVARGFTRNLGPHALYLGGGLDRALERLSVKVSGSKVSGAGSRVLDGEVLRPMPGSALSIAFTSWLSARDRATLMGAFARVALETPGAHAGETVEAYLDSICGGDPKRLFRALVRVSTYGGDLDRMSAECAIAQLQAGLLAGVMYLDGGWQTIVDGLCARLSAQGVAVRTGAKVRGISGAGPFDLVVADAAVRARAVIVTGSPELAAELVETNGGSSTDSPRAQSPSRQRVSTSGSTRPCARPPAWCSASTSRTTCKITPGTRSSRPREGAWCTRCDTTTVGTRADATSAPSSRRSDAERSRYPRARSSTRATCRGSRCTTRS